MCESLHNYYCFSLANPIDSLVCFSQFALATSSKMQFYILVFFLSPLKFTLFFISFCTSGSHTLTGGRLHTGWIGIVINSKRKNLVKWFSSGSDISLASSQKCSLVFCLLMVGVMFAIVCFLDFMIYNFHPLYNLYD